jgi:hypothetical protein
MFHAVNEKLLSNVILENIIVIQVQIKLIFQVELLTLQYRKSRKMVTDNKTSLTLSLFIEMSVPSQESDWSCIYVLGVLILPFSMVF